MQLKEAVREMLSGNSRACKEVAEYCHQTARAYLEYKLKDGDDQLIKLLADRENLAWDCIAGLFERNEKDQYVIFEEYLANYNWNEVDESETKMVLRRLVFSKVNDGIFRNFGSLDPSLRKIIRNIKLAVENVEGLKIANSNGQKILKCNSVEDDSCLPVLPPEFLEIRLFNRIEEKMSTPDIIKEFKKILEDQHIYKSSIAVSQLAVCIRKVYARMNSFLQKENNDGKKAFLESEIKAHIDQAIERQKQELVSTYLESGKMKEEIFFIYFDAVRDIIQDDFVKENPDADTYFEHLQVHMPNLSKEEYRSDHRQYLEYFTQKTRDDLVKVLKKDLQHSAER